jgi:hypothetical protein
MIFPGDVLGIVVCPKDRGDNNRIKIEKPNKGTLKLLIEKVGEGISGVRLGRVRPENIVAEFLKTLLIENNKT